MLEIYEVFDASNEELLSELQNLQQLLRTAAGSNHVQYKMLYDTVRQELEERGVSHKLFQQLAPSAPPAASVPMLYSFGSLAPGTGAGGGGGGGSGGSAAAATNSAGTAAGAPAATGAPSYAYSNGQHFLSYQQNSQPSNGGMAQAVNAMVMATVRHHQPATMTNGPAASPMPPAVRPQEAMLPPSGLLSASLLPPAPVPPLTTAAVTSAAANATAHPLLRNYDLGPPAAAVKPPPPPPPPPTALPRPPPPPALTLQPQLQPQPQLPQQPPQAVSPPQPALQIQVQVLSPGPTPGGALVPTPFSDKARNSSGDGGGAGRGSDSGGGGGGGNGGGSSGAGSESDGDGRITPAGLAGAAGRAGRPGGEASTMSVGSNAAAEAGAAGGGSGPGAAGGGGKQLTPWEAAMLAFQEEQRLLRKARKAIRKGPPAKPGPKKPVAVSPSHASGAHHHPPLGAESSSGSTRTCPKPPRPSATGGTAATATTPGAGRGTAHASASAAPISPHGAAALAAGAAAAARSGAGGSSGKPGAAPNAPAPGAANGAAAKGAAGSGAGAKPGGASGSQMTAAGAAGAGAAVGGSAAAGSGSAAGGGAAPASAPVRALARATPAGAASAADLDAVPEEQGLAARTAPADVAEVALVQNREPSEPESVKTDEESSEVLAAAMREAAAAAAAAGRGGKADGASSDSDPESVSSGDSQQRAQGARQNQQQQQRLSRDQDSPGAPAARTQPGSWSAPPGPMGHDGPGAPGPGANGPPQPRAMSASQASPSRQQLQQPRPGQPTLVSSSVKSPRTAAAAATPPRSAWGAAPAAAAPPSPQGGPEGDTVSTESDSGADSDAGSVSDYAVSPGVRGLAAGQRRAGQGNSHPVLLQAKAGAEEDGEEARQRRIAAAAAAAIRGRSAADASVYVGPANQLAKAVVGDGPMKVDRWSDWDLADSSDALSAWGTHHDYDPVRDGPLRVPRPVGHLAPPESLVTGPPGAHALPQPLAQQGVPTGGGGGGSRQGLRSGEGVTAPRAGSAPHSSSGRRGATAEPPAARGAAKDGATGGGSGSQSSDDDDGGAGTEPGSGRRGGTSSQAGTASPLPRAGVVAAGTKASALVSGAAAPAGGAPGAASPPVRRPPLAPGASTPPHSAGRSANPSSTGGAAPGLPRGGGGSSGNLASSPAAAATPSSATSETATAVAPYLQFYSAFHEILTMCYSSLPVMLDAAALSSASVATVAGGGGGGGSRPPSRMLMGSAAAAAAAGFDLIERYNSLLVRCEAWQTKLRQLTGAMPADDGGGTPGADGGTTAAAPPSVPSATVSAGTGGVSPRSGGSGPATGHGSQQQLQQQQQQTAALPMPTQQTRRYVAIIDDTAHPEVRNVVVAALRLLAPAWALDPADQVTEVAKPELSPDDDGGGGGGSNPSSRPPTALPSGGGTSRPVASSGAVGAGLGSSATGQGSGSGGGAAAASSGNSSGGGGGATGGSRCHIWNVLWSWSVKVRVPVNELLVWQRVNHFAEARQLTRKDLLKKHLAKYQAMHNTGRSAALFDRLTPTTFVLPKEAAAFEEAFVRALHGVEPTCVQPVGLNLWIQKPVGLSRGRGISLISSLKKVNTAEAMVVQRYLTDPLLVEGYKFDLRLYVLVTSFNPLEAWMYDEGFARFTTLPYTLDEAELGNMYVHLTNSSVQRTRAEAGQLPAFLQAAEPAGGSKTSLATLRRLLARHGVDWSLLWSRVGEVATAALFAAQDAIPHSPNSFELFGFDMMIDAELKVWLLEVNSSPSMGLDTPLDQAIKPRLIADVLELLAPMPFDRAALTSVLRARTNTSRAGRRGMQGLLSGTASEERELCCTDLQAVLGGALPRRYGERPRHVGGFTTCLAPSPFHDRLLKLRRPLP